MTVEKGMSYELSRSNPEAFKVASIQALGRSSVFGAEIWNRLVDRGMINPNKLAIDTSTWESGSNAIGDITLGSRPMSPTMKERLHFHSERFSYTDEVTYRLLHESMHSYLYFTRNTPDGKNLLQAATNVRCATNGVRGLTTLGSLDYYKGDDKIIEDTTELMTMYAWSPEYTGEFTEFLADPSEAGTRKAVGLVNMAKSQPLLGLIARAVENNL